MDYAFLGLMITAIWWAAAVAYALAATFSLFVVAWVSRDVWRMIKYKREKRSAM